MATAGNTVNKLQKFAYSTANNTMVHNTDVVVQGNLTVRGTQTYAQTQTLLVQDNIITLNAAINQSGVPLFDAGIEIDRGQEQNVSLLWKESEGAWKFTNDGVNYETLGGGSAGSYANAAFLQANAAFASANNVAPQVQPAFDKANSAGLYANAAFIKANAAYAFANSTTAWGTRQTFVATAGQTVFNVGSGYLVGYIDVYYNGIKLYGGDDYTASDGLSVTLTNPALVNDIIEVVGFGANVPVANIYVLNSTTSFLNRQTFFATANQTTFTPTQSYRVGFIDVYYNGLKMVIPDDVVANNGTTIEFIGLTPTTNDVIEIVGLTPNVALANAIPITGGSVSGNLLPAATNTYYLGSATNRWHSLFLGPASLDIDGLVLSNSGGTLAVTSAAGAPSTFIDTFARGQANAAFNSANNVAPQVQPAFDRANAAFAAANNVAPQIQPAFDTANAAFAAANNVAPQIAPAFTQANAAFNKANSAAQYSANTAVTDFLAIPIGTTAQRPVSAAPGSIRYNTTLSRIEGYLTGGGWQSILTDSYQIEYLVIAGGGGGGGATRGGGGGAGGYRSSVQGENSGRLSAAESVLTVSGGVVYSVVVGAGGASGPYGASNEAVAGVNGSNSSFSVITSVGGGGGGASDNSGTDRSAKAGGSGGGGWYGTAGQPGAAGTTGQGFPGGVSGTSSPYGGGGGGAGAPGGNFNSPGGPVGGIGIQSAISGSPTYRAGGGSSSDYTVNSNFSGGNGGGGIGRNAPGTTVGLAPSNGTDNTGGGGGASGNGGSGVVIIRYPGGQRGLGGTITSVGGYTIHTFTGSGTFTA